MSIEEQIRFVRQRMLREYIEEDTDEDMWRSIIETLTKVQEQQDTKRLDNLEE